MSSNMWRVVHSGIVIGLVGTPMIWLILSRNLDHPPWWLVAGWSVMSALVGVWMMAASINAAARRVDAESRVLRAGHRNGRPQ